MFFFDLLVKSTLNSRGHVSTISYLTTLFLGKPPGGSLPVFTAHFFTSKAVTDNLLFLIQLRREKFFTKECAGCEGRYHTKQTCQGVQRRMVLVVNFFRFLKLFFSLLLL